MSQNKTVNVGTRILSLASEVTEVSNQNVPVLLLKLKEILKSAPSLSKESKKLKEDLYHYDLIQYCILVLKQDYSRVNGGWATAAKLAEILSNCCVGLDPTEDIEEFYNKVLPSAVDNLLFLGRRLQDEEKNEFLHFIQTVTNSLCWLFGGHIQLAVCVLHCDHFLQLLMTDDVETGTTVMSVLQNILRVNSTVLPQMDENILHCILDELVYKLSSATNPVIGNAATKSLLLMVESHQPLAQLLIMRYRGLRALLSKQWTGKGFGRELGRLLDFLYSGSYQQVEMQRLHQAACLIQAVWKGFQTRNRLKKLPKVVTSLQRGFRAKREQELLHFKRLKEEEDLKQQLQLQRRRAMRIFREKQLTLLEIVHAGQVDRHMQEMQEKSALMIQRHWRGHKERRIFHQQRQALKQYKAAVTIQRAAIRFLKKRRRIREALSPWKGPAELTDARRLELQEKIDEYFRLHPVSQLSEEQGKELHVHAQETLGQYLLKRRLQQKAELRREALLAQINTDITMLMNAPVLKEATEKHLEDFTSRSMPVAAKAKQCHNTMLKYTRWPWWKKLGDEFMDDEVVPKEMPAVEYGTLYIGGSKPS
ncbi:IQ calmodulin-binding motif-containing protein 1 isoform X2 [Microcaecilia unicolor]|uniref:IQ calmodulin-binding motif-containing protein 1 isoform X2 n=1 Tax=Microcaecilia unicolor TaxID=1415580 RepID=A0A6P7YLD9_9AMPH|nr:IQ calmodulin-binding motif-containing protein 1 isoform X2 [Microcaecilia unicolor]